MTQRLTPRYTWAVKIAIDSDDLPAATRLNTWRSMLCDTYIGMDCHFPCDDFRSIINGHVVGDHTITRIRSSRHSVDRSKTLIKRDGLDFVFFAIPLAGRATIIQGGRETKMEPGTIILSDSSRPFHTYVEEQADILWLSVPKQPMAERVRGIEDLAAIALKPAKPIDNIAIGLMAGLDEALRPDLPPHLAESLTLQTLDLLAMTIVSAGLPPVRHGRVTPPSSIQ